MGMSGLQALVSENRNMRLSIQPIRMTLIKALRDAPYQRAAVTLLLVHNSAAMASQLEMTRQVTHLQSSECPAQGFLP